MLPLLPGVPVPVVLDTNIILDVWRFQNPLVNPIRQAINCGQISCMTDQICLEELFRVLRYPALGLTAGQAEDIYHRYVSVADVFNRTTSAPRLPLCHDPNDQCFLELAARSEAKWLISRDRQVLKMAKGYPRKFSFQIIPVQKACQYLEGFSASQEATPSV